MTTRLEILSETNGVLSVALYHEVPENQYNPLSDNGSRLPAGSALTSVEVALLKEGRIIETLAAFSIGEKNRSEVREGLRKLWRESIESVRKQYKNDYSYVGSIWDSEAGWR